MSSASPTDKPTSAVGNLVLLVILIGLTILGIAVVHWGLDNLHRDRPYCDGKAMERGDICMHIGRHTENMDYDRQLADEHRGARIQIGFGALLTLVSGVLGVTAVGVALRTEPPPRNLAGLMLSPDEVSGVLGVPGMTITATRVALFDDSAALTETACLAAANPAQQTVYGPAGWTAAQVHTLSGPDDGTEPWVIQAVIGFPSAAAAAAAAAEQARQWASCPGRTVTYPGNTSPTRWTFGPLTNTGDTLAINRIQEAGNGWSAQHAVAVRQDVIVDVLVYGRWEQPTQAVDLLDAIAAKMPDAPPRPSTRSQLAAPAPAPVPVAALEPLLLTPEQIGDAVGVPGLAIVGTNNSLNEDSAELVEKDLLGPYAAAQQHVYDGTGWVAARIHKLSDNPDGGSDHWVWQSVVAFVSAQAAAAALAHQTERWQGSSGRILTVERAQETVRWVFGPVTSTGDALAITGLQEGGNGWAIQRAVAVRNNVIVDTQVSGHWDGGAQAVDLLDALAARIPGAPPASTRTRDRLAAPPPSPVGISALEPLLLPPERLSGIVGVPNLAHTYSGTALYDDAVALEGEDKECVGVFWLAQRNAYAGTGWVGARIHDVTDGLDTPHRRIMQAVIGFASAPAAAAVLADQVRQWEAMTGRAVTCHYDDGSTARWVFGAFRNTGDTLAITRVREDSDRWAAQRALTARGNVIVDVSAVGRWDADDVAVRVSEQIAARVPAPVSSARPAASGPRLAFDTTGLQPTAAGWVDPRTGDDFRVAEISGKACGVPLEQIDPLRRWLTVGIGRQGCVIEAHVLRVEHLPTLLYILKAPNPRGTGPAPGVVYTVSIVVPRAEVFLQLNGNFPEDPPAGARDAAVGVRLAGPTGPAAMYPPHPYAPESTSVLPYSVADERRWDEFFPEHPLSRARRWAHHVLPTIRIDPTFAAQPRFTG